MPAAADDALLHVPEALEFSEWREAELDSRRALAPVQLAGCKWPASLRLVEEKGPWITEWKKPEQESPHARLCPPLSLNGLQLAIIS